MLKQIHFLSSLGRKILPFRLESIYNVYAKLSFSILLLSDQLTQMFQLKQVHLIRVVRLKYLPMFVR